jgi:hypothetical protein
MRKQIVTVAYVKNTSGEYQARTLNKVLLFPVTGLDSVKKLKDQYFHGVPWILASFNDLSSVWAGTWQTTKHG